ARSRASFSRDHDADARIIEKFEGRQGEYFPPKNSIEERHVQRLFEIEKIRADVVRTAIQGLCTFLGTTRETRKQVLIVSTWVPGGMSGFAYDDFRQIQRAAARGNTAIYPWDPRGLLMYPLTSIRAHEWFKVLAEQTGGRAIVNTNDGLPGMRSMLDDSSSYYLIGYTSTENVHDGKFHEVKVKVKRPGVTLRAKPGYFAYDADAIERAAAPPPPPVDADVTAALEAAEAPDQGRALVAWAGFDRDASGAATVSVVWESGDPRAAIDHADVIAVSDTSSFRGRGQNAVTFPAKPGDLSIRVAASAADGSPVETTMLSMAVPPPGKVQLTTPRFFRGRTVRVVSAADAVPTASREFTRQDQVAVRAHAWTDGGAPATIAARLLSDHGVVLQDLAAEPTAAGYASIAVPVGALGLGRYVIEITAATRDGTARVLAAFRVK
ncbi:MAG: VWA domain-containing protein, partial [Acidobacteria bacterium]